METAQLIPVSEWVYNLYKVEYWTCEGGKLIKTLHITASCDGHMWSEANENAPYNSEWMSYEIVKQNVGHPHTVGFMYGQKVYESGVSHAKRLTS